MGSNVNTAIFSNIKRIKKEMKTTRPLLDFRYNTLKNLLDQFPYKIHS